ncbi:hypothetical protein CUMW_289290 [Citrus unshiu]|uniref:Uncharacterized protein n=1 Tax=Citrus unshiu TaxID=55188 RepID=A0A2H5QYB6_CITUN|nr:hypothetical protein CUMW_289290 [Citrus unshiu]
MQANQELAKFFKILTTSVDEYNKVYVLTVQAYNYPVTAFQWHSEVLTSMLLTVILAAPHLQN